VDAAEFDPARFGDDVRAAIRKRFGIPGDALLYTFVGTFGTWHGTDVLASAILSLREKSGDWLRETRAHFLFVGDGPLGADARQRLATPVDEGLVTFIGLRGHEETPSLLAASDVLLAPHKPNEDGSRFFGSPTKLFEYMSMARLIVASDLDQIGEVLRGYGARDETTEAGEAPAGILVRPGDPDSLAEGMRRAGSMPESDRLAIGRRARAIVLRALTWDRNVETMVRHLLEKGLQ
jgi:glycosyltransferase involved in cell wall biosynthesis